jgi:hypothetical protein
MADRNRLVRWAAIAVLVGLAVELLSVFLVHPLSFVAILGLGVTAQVLGILLYLRALLRKEPVGREPVLREPLRREPGLEPERST